jgi:hypothetical protein
MRYIGLLLASLLMIGCGNATKGGDPLRMVTFSPPAITTLTPDGVPVNSVPFTMTVNGSNFGTDAVVFWNGMPLNTMFITSNQVMAALTDTDLSFAGMINVYVRTAGQNSNTVTFDLSGQ